MSKKLFKLDMEVVEVEDSTGTSLRHRFILSNNLNLELYTKTFRCKLTRFFFKKKFFETWPSSTLPTSWHCVLQWVRNPEIILM